MNGFGNSLIKTMVRSGNCECMVEACQILHGNIMTFLESNTEDLRVFIDKESGPVVMIPKKLKSFQESYLADAIESGAIFDDCKEVYNTADYMVKTTLPCEAAHRNNISDPETLKMCAGSIIGKIGHDGLEISDTDIDNCRNYLHDIMKHPPQDMTKITDDYLHAHDHDDLPKKFRRDMDDGEEEVADMQKVNPEDIVDPDGYEYVGDEDELKQEGFFNRPKKLKPIPRDVIAYITVEMNAIKDSNDQAMLSGYTCSKLELVDFYINCIDTQDDRYIVPHDRAYLVNMQQQLNSLLSQILRIRPINRNDRMWRVGVTYPEGR